MKKNITLFILCFNYTICLSQNYNLNNFSYFNYTTKDGLCGNEVVKTIKDKNGFLWVATHNGLSRFDGKKFTTYTYLPNDTTTLRSIWITDILIDKQNTLWVSTEWGICWYDENLDRFRYINKKDELIVLYTSPMVLGNENDLWIACENGLFKINTVKKEFEKTLLSRITDPTCLTFDSNKNIWIGTRGNGLFKFNTIQNKTDKLNYNLLPANTDYLGVLNEGENIWFATSEGLLRINKETIFSLFFKGENNLSTKIFKQLTTVEKIDSVNFICGTYDKKLLIFNKLTQKFTQQLEEDINLPKATYISIFKDKNILWISTHNGLCKMKNNINNIKYVPLKNGGVKFNFQKVLQDNTNVNLYWLLDGSTSPKLVLYDDFKSKTLKISSCKSPTNSDYNKATMVQLNNGAIYTFVNKFINIFSKDAIWQKEIICKEHILSSFVENENSIWLGTENGIANFNVTKNAVKYFPLSYNGTDIENKSLPQKFPVYGLAIDKNGLVWLSNLKHGLFSFNKNTNTLIAHRQPSNLSYETLNRCTSLAIQNDTVWVGTMSGMSAYAINQNKFTNYNLSNGLANTYVYNITKAKDNIIWGRGNAGLFKLNLIDYTFKNFNLPPLFDNFYFMQQVADLSGDCLLGLENGFALMKDNDAESENLKTYISSASVNGKRIFNNKEPFKLKYFENNIQFDFTTINFSDETIDYVYMLDGLSETWTDANKKDNLLFTNLPAGKYIFKVKAKRIKDNIYGNESSFTFVIHAAFWQTWWFKLLLILCVAAIFFAIAYWKVTSIKKNETEKTAVNKMMGQLETKLLRSQMNPHFIFNSLNSIQKYIWENKEEAAAEYLSSFAKLIRAILENSRKDFISLSEEIKILKLYIELEQRRSNNKFSYTFFIDDKLDLEKMEVPPLLLQPFIENAIWHGLNKKEGMGNLFIKMEQVTDDIIYTVDDNGVGRNTLKDSKNLLKESLGIDITKQRISLLVNNTNADDYLKITDKFEGGKPVGTRVEVTLPVKYLHA